MHNNCACMSLVFSIMIKMRKGFVCQLLWRFRYILMRNHAHTTPFIPLTSHHTPSPTILKPPSQGPLQAWSCWPSSLGAPCSPPVPAAAASFDLDRPSPSPPPHHYHHQQQQQHPQHPLQHFTSFPLPPATLISALLLPTAVAAARRGLLVPLLP